MGKGEGDVVVRVLLLECSKKGKNSQLLVCMKKPHPGAELSGPEGQAVRQGTGAGPGSGDPLPHTVDPMPPQICATMDPRC